MKLFATPLSHFSRKVRVLLDLYGAPYEFVDIGNVAEGTMETFNGNPLMKVPVLADGENWIVESDHIAAYLVRKIDPSDRYRVLAADLFTLNARAILNGMMMEEVKYILAKRTGVPVADYRFFDDALEAVANALEWLEKNADGFNPARPGYLEFHLLSAWEHLAHYELLSPKYPRLRAIAAELLRDPKLRQTSPFVLKPKT